jgi:hypothetical protein
MGREIRYVQYFPAHKNAIIFTTTTTTTTTSNTFNVNVNI